MAGVGGALELQAFLKPEVSWNTCSLPLCLRMLAVTTLQSQQHRDEEAVCKGASSAAVTCSSTYPNKLQREAALMKLHCCQDRWWYLCKGLHSVMQTCLLGNIYTTQADSPGQHQTVWEKQLSKESRASRACTETEATLAAMRILGSYKSPWQ